MSTAALRNKPFHDPCLLEDARNPNQMRIATALLLAVSVLALAMRLHALDAESLWLDEFSQVSLYSLPLSYVVTESARITQPPLDIFIGAGLHRLGLADHDGWVRVPAALFGAGGVFLLGWWIRRIAGTAAGVAAALLLAVCPLHLAMSQEVRPYTLLFFLSLLTLAMFARAHRRNTLLSWSVFSTVLLALLLTRWVEPHFITLGLAAYAAGAWFAAWRRAEPEWRPGETIKLWAAGTAVLAAYAVYNPVFGILFDRNRRAITSHASEEIERFSYLLSTSYTAMFSGYSWRTLYSALPASALVLTLAGVLAVLGLTLLIRSALQGRDPLIVLFVVAVVPFPFVYGAVFARLANAPSKPQYLLLMAAPLFGCIAIAVDALRRWTARRSLTLSWIVPATLLTLLVVPMAQASVHGLQVQNKRDWRDALTFLRDHADPDDAFAAISPDCVPTRFYTTVGGLGRYFTPHTKFLRIELRTDDAVLSTPPWQRVGCTVWVLCYRDPMYTGTDLLSAPTDFPSHINVHDFNGLFLLEVRGRSPAADRLMEGLTLLYRDLPEGRSLVAPAYLQARFLLAQGDLAGGRAAFETARRQCRNETEIRFLANTHHAFTETRERHRSALRRLNGAATAGARSLPYRSD